MSSKPKFKAAALARTLAIGLVAATLVTAPAHQALAQAVQNASSSVDLSVGRGRLISLPAAMTDVFVANDEVADVQVRSSRQLYIFGKKPGETSIYATDASGRVVYSTVARVGNNIETIDQMLSLAMPEATISANTMNGFVLLTGTVHSPDDAAEAERLVQAFVGDQTKVLSRLRTATPLQVNLQVRIAEVNRSLVKEISGNLLTRDRDGPLGNGFLGGVFGGRSAGEIAYPTAPTAIFPPNTVPTPYNPVTGQPLNSTTYGKTYTINTPAGVRSLAGAGRLFGLDLIASLDAGERSGMVVTLAQPNLTAISGETADFLAGGEFPVPIPGNFAGTTIEYRKYGVSLAYTPTVLSNGRISLRVRPEVSELSTEGAIELQGFQVPALTVRRAETTVELGSGESFMIAGLMNNRSIGAIDKMPGLGDVPLLGMLFKSDSFRRGETELVIIVTPYLVQPVSANDIKLPTDAYQDANDAARLLINQTSNGVTGGDRPKPRLDTSPADADRLRAGADVSPGFSIK
ncbi:type II and III secretion system protein family protein [Sphingopyxis sp. OPL5]|uniref:type II and III secretion system protein family protein n=1 Tax=Sphingopyxis sp. OPL5 TaxID=2486273 RepID=UPI00164E1243|nr:type II and III secretion system protein family protein [Sphingopyxis sp. OPL5]QNO27201.1 type II and III secretion system protein family protein [Sphingopyxis sp. OPL5]